MMTVMCAMFQFMPPIAGAGMRGHAPPPPYNPQMTKEFIAKQE